MEERWFENIDKFEKEVGIVFDTSLEQKVHDIHSSRKENNSNMCSICFIEFEEESEEYRPYSLACGHQFNGICWTNYLKDKVKDSGATCVFTKCP